MRKISSTSYLRFHAEGFIMPDLPPATSCQRSPRLFAAARFACTVLALVASLAINFDTAAQAEPDRPAVEEQQHSELMRAAYALYESGQYDQALAHYEALAEQGYPDAMIRVAIMKMGGWGVDKDHAAAVAMLRRLIDTGASEEHYRLWSAYRDGVGGVPGRARCCAALPDKGPSG